MMVVVGAWRAGVKVINRDLKLALTSTYIEPEPADILSLALYIYSSLVAICNRPL
jgi:hypothetical protein